MEARVDVDSALVASDLLVGKSVAGVPGEPARLLYRLELRRAPGDAERILTLEVLSRGGGVATAVLSGRNVAKRWEDASAEFRLVSLSALVAERLLGLPAVRDVDAALLTRRLEEISRVRSNDADVRRLVRAVKEDRGAGRFAPEVEPKR